MSKYAWPYNVNNITCVDAQNIFVLNVAQTRKHMIASCATKWRVRFVVNCCIGIQSIRGRTMVKFFQTYKKKKKQQFIQIRYMMKALFTAFNESDKVSRIFIINIKFIYICRKLA